MTAVAPKSDSEVFAEYYPHVKYLVRKAGIRHDFVEDYSMMLMEKFIAKNVLNDYDPSYVSEVDGTPRTANFRTFFSGFVTAYLRHYVKRDRIDAQRHSTSIDAKVKSQNNEDSDILFLDLVHKIEPDLQGPEFDELISNVRRQFEGNGKMLLLLDLVLLQMEEYGELDWPELAEMFEVTRTTIYNWKKKLTEAFERCR